MILVVVTGLAALAACSGSARPSQSGAGTTTSVAAEKSRVLPVGPFLTDPNDPTKRDTHWHAALGVYDCNHWMGDTPGSGVWNWPNATPEGAPARASNPGQYAGLHSHDDGVIHMEPAVPDETGANATLGHYFEFGGWKVSATGFTFLGVTRATGDTCRGTPGTVQWEVGKWDGKTGKQKYVVQTGDPAAYKLFDFDIVVIAFVPRAKTIAEIGDPPSVKILGGELQPSLVGP